MKRLLILFFLLFLCQGSLAQVPFSWDQATVYFVLTDRFANGDPSNDHAYGRGTDAKGGTSASHETGHFFGGDLRGLTEKLESGYFDDLGVNAIWITPPFEQIHGWVGGSEGAYQAYAYHGYWILDFTTLDANLGTEDDFQAFMASAHKRGIRVLLDVVLNHAGYATMQDMETFNFGAFKADGWQNWHPAAGENWHSYHDRFIDYEGSDSLWGRWWGPSWIRAGLPGYDPCGDDEVLGCLSALPDFKTDTETEVTLPTFLVEKWGPEKTAQMAAELDTFFAHTGYPRTPRFHLIKWLTDWVRKYGVDGFRIDTAKHVELDTWQYLKDEALLALTEWKSNHPDASIDDLPFWMVGEVWGHDVTRTEYFDHGFDAVLNFSFQHEAARANALDSLYTTYANRLLPDPTFNVLSYISSHDTELYDREDLINAGTRLMLLPGGIQVYYGDETARPKNPASSPGHEGLRSPMNWENINKEVLEHWQKLAQFRKQHPAVAAGVHQTLNHEPYTFHRGYQQGVHRDDVIVVIGASGRTRLNVSRIYADDTALRDAYSGKIAMVSYGQVSFTPHENGVLLIEEVK